MYRVNEERSQAKNDHNGLMQRCTKVINANFFEEKVARRRDAAWRFECLLRGDGRSSLAARETASDERVAIRTMVRSVLRAVANRCLLCAIYN
jgi:hypothetical protein